VAGLFDRGRSTRGKRHPVSSRRLIAVTAILMPADCQLRTAEPLAKKLQARLDEVQSEACARRADSWPWQLTASLAGSVALVAWLVLPGGAGRPAPPVSRFPVHASATIALRSELARAYTCTRRIPSGMAYGNRPPSFSLGEVLELIRPGVPLGPPCPFQQDRAAT
jgi:hypothetical protein